MKNKGEIFTDIGGTIFKIDLDAFNNALATKETSDKKIEVETFSTFDSDGKLIGFTVKNVELERGIEIDGPKYDLLRMCLEIIFTYSEDVDDAMGVNKALESTTIPFKIAFNTLISYGILTEVETE